MSEPPSPVPRAVLDSNVIFSRVLHKLMGRVAREARLLDLIWSEQLLAEAKRVLIEAKPASEPIAERWVSYLRGAFPDGHIDITSVADDIDLSAMTSDPDDEHVCALALAGDAQLLVTFDDGYAIDALRARGVTVVEPDAILAPAFDEHPALIQQILERQASAWGGRTMTELLDALDRARVPILVSKVRAAIE